MDTIKQVLYVVITLVMFVGILYLAYLTTKFIGKRYTFKGKGGKNIKVLESVGVGKDSQIMLIKAGEKNLLVGVTPQNINLITEVNAEDIDVENDEQSATAPEQMDFATALKININKKLGKDILPTDKGKGTVSEDNDENNE